MLVNYKSYQKYDAWFGPIEVGKEVYYLGQPVEIIEIIGADDGSGAEVTFMTRFAEYGQTHTDNMNKWPR